MENASYEQIRDSDLAIPDGTRLKWQHADETAQRLRQQYAELEEDEDLTPEAKAQRAIDAHARAEPRIIEKREAARESLLSQARANERNAKPWPSGQPKDVSNNTEILQLAYAESERLVRLASKRSELPGPFGSSNTDFLREQYKKGLDIGGVQGSALCLAAERAGEELSVPLESIISPFRTDAQIKAQDDARRLEHFSNLISTKGAPPPPRSLTKGPQRARREINRTAPVMMPGSEPMVVSSGPSHTGRKAKKKKSA